MLQFCLFVSAQMTDEEQGRFLAIYHAHIELIKKITYKYIENQVDAEDAMQETLLAIARNLHKLTDPESIETRVYISKVAKSAAMNLLRKSKATVLLPLEENINKAMEEIEAEVAAEEGYQQIKAYLKSLPDQYIDPLTLYIVLGMSVKEISLALGRSAFTVKSQIRRGQQMLRKKFGKGLLS